MKPSSTPEEPGANGNGPTAVSAEMAEAALEKILASPGFANAERLSRFLSFAVRETLAGGADKLKESMLGVEVFRRKPTYDPRMDAVVRTEAVKLRARLKEYYESEGREDAVRIDLPKGAYVARFSVREADPVEAADAAPASVEPPSGEERSMRGVAIAGSIVVLALAAAAVYSFRIQKAASRAPSPNSIAVLPFVDLSPQRDQEYFCDGMTEEIIDALTRAGAFRVVARTSSFAFKGKQQDIREIGRKLDVGAVLEGSVRKDGDRLRVTAQLISVADGYHLWSETYERELKDVFTVQDEISRAIVDTLRQKLPQRAAGAPRAQTEDIATYELFLKGRFYWNRWRTEGAEKAIGYLDQAIARDPNYAPAWAGLADSYAWLAFFGDAAPTEAMPKARAAAEKAIALDDSLAEAHVSLGYIRALYDWDWSGAKREFQRAVEVNPNSPDAHFGYGLVYLAPLGRTDEALAELRRAVQLDPLSLVNNTYLGLVLQFDGRGDAAIEQFQRVLDMDPSFAEAHYELAEAYAARRRYGEAKREIDQISGMPEARLDLFRAALLARQGDRTGAERLLRDCEKRAEGAYVRPTSFASVYLALGDKRSAMKWLERGYMQRDGMLAYLACSHGFNELRSEPAYVELLKKLGLPGGS